MGADRALFFLNELVWTALIVCAPILLATLVVGVVIGVFQVATQIQEITLSYVPSSNVGPAAHRASGRSS